MVLKPRYIHILGVVAIAVNKPSGVEDLSGKYGSKEKLTYSSNEDILASPSVTCYNNGRGEGALIHSERVDRAACDRQKQKSEYVEEQNLNIFADRAHF